MNNATTHNYECFFSEIIGYSGVKKELYQVLDTMINTEKYERIGARTPRGALLFGQPGIGKSMMASAFMKASGRNCFVLRRNQPDSTFANEIRRVFELAASSEPAIILLDDMDKFATDKESGDGYSTVQACIDDVKDKNVFVIATANNLGDIPNSLMREGRFDVRIKMRFPKGQDAVDIIRYYLTSKSVSDVNYEDITNMLTGKSCAVLESILNAAAILAAYHGKDKLGMEEIVSATLSQMYGVSQNRDEDEISLEAREKIAYHEAGHTVIAELLSEGSVGFVSVNSMAGNKCGFMLLCEELEQYNHQVLLSLGGKAAVELQYGSVADGTYGDINEAIDVLKETVSVYGALGTSLVGDDKNTEFSKFMQENAYRIELERYLFKAKEILAKNREFLHAVAKELLEKSVLLHSDIRRIRSSVTIVPVAVG